MGCLLKAVSLFSGCGGSDLGLHRAGCEVVLANDISPYAKDFYEANLPETDFKLIDVQELKSFPDADILVGCYPCQGFSQGGARKVDRKINFLYREFDRALRTIKPKAFNTPHDGKKLKLRILQNLDDTWGAVS